MRFGDLPLPNVIPHSRGDRRLVIALQWRTARGDAVDVAVEHSLACQSEGAGTQALVETRIARRAAKGSVGRTRLAKFAVEIELQLATGARGPVRDDDVRHPRRRPRRR